MGQIAPRGGGRPGQCRRGEDTQTDFLPRDAAQLRRIQYLLSTTPTCTTETYHDSATRDYSGKVMMAEIVVPTVGKMAVILDPVGAGISLFQPDPPAA